MKHIFHIHNQSSYLSSLCIVESKKISRCDVIFMCFRGFKNNDEYIKAIYLDDKIYYHRFNSTRYLFNFGFVKNNQYIKIVDSWLDNIGDDFTYYVPHCRNPLYSIIITNSKCKQVHYIEDGSDAYLTKIGIQYKFAPVQHWSHKVLSPLFYFFGSSRIVFYSNLYEPIGVEPSICYGLNDKSFLNDLQAKREILKINEEIIRKFPCDTKYNKIFVLDALVEQGVVSKETLLDLIKLFIIKEGDCPGVSIKFHPAQSEDVRVSVLDIFKVNSFTVEVLPENFMFEVFCILNKSCKIFGVGSSVLLYSRNVAPQLTFPMYNYIPKNKILDIKRYKVWKDMFESDI